MPRQGAATSQPQPARVAAALASRQTASGTTADASGTAAPGDVDRPEQIAEHWRADLSQWLGGASRDLSIEYRYPVDVESEPNPFGQGFGPSGEA